MQDQEHVANDEEAQFRSSWIAPWLGTREPWEAAVTSLSVLATASSTSGGWED